MTTWNGEIDNCQICNHPLNGKMVDGRLKGGRWANLCMDCHKEYGVGLGTGRGQYYELTNNV